jgi:predicted enzyme related to lactoylglutathione lyase
MGNAVTHFEIVGEDASRLQDFHREAFGWEVLPAGPGRRPYAGRETSWRGAPRPRC